MGGKVYTATESPILNRCDTIWNIYVSEGFALSKSPFSNRCDTIWDIYVSERFALNKSPFPNRCDTIWDIYAGERFATSVFVNSFISTVYGLKGRKMMARIL